MLDHDVYEVFAHHQRQDLMQVADVNRYLKSRQQSSPHDRQEAPAFLAWLLTRLSSKSLWKSRDVKRARQYENHLTIG
jgi:hypothetical protein